MTNVTIDGKVYYICRWDLSVQDCMDKSFYITNLKISMTLSALFFVLVMSFLVYRCLVLGTPLWSGKQFAPLDGLLFWLMIWAVLRFSASVIKLLDLWPTSIWRYVFFNFGWWIGNIAIATYTCGLFYAIPRMQSHRISSIYTTTRTIYIPNPAIVPYIYWSLFAINIIFFETFGILAIRARFAHSSNELLFWRIHWLGIVLEQLVLMFALLYYGRMLVHLARECVTLAAAEDEKNRYKSFGNKMQSANFGFTIGFVAYSLALLCFILLQRRMFMDPSANKIYAAAMENCSSLLAIGITSAMIYCEVKQTFSTLSQELSTVWTLNDRI